MKIIWIIAMIVSLSVALADDMSLQMPIKDGLTPVRRLVTNCGVGIKDCACGDTLMTSYTLTSDILNCQNGLIIGADSIILNCNGFTIDGNGANNGISAVKRSNIMISNCKIQDFFNGLNLTGSLNITLKDNVFVRNMFGAYLRATNKSTFIGNDFINNTYFGLMLYSSQKNVFYENLFNNTANAYEDATSNNNKWNTTIGNAWDDYLPTWPAGYAVDGPGNGVDLRPIKYQILHCGDPITEDTMMANDLIDCPGNGLKITSASKNLNCHGHTIDGTGNGYGIAIDYTMHANKIRNCIIQQFASGIEIYSDDNKIKHNTIRNNGNGITIFDYNFNYISDNMILDNYNIGVYLKEYGYYLSWQDNYIWNNSFIGNTYSAWEDIYARENYWNISRTGNYWSDFSSNPGYPFKYIIPGPSGGVDYWPVGKKYPWCGDTLTEDTVLKYDITGCTGTALRPSSGITLDCQGHLINGTKGTSVGIATGGLHDVTTTNCVIKNFQYGYQFSNGVNQRVVNNTLINNDYGISGWYPEDSLINNNTIINSTNYGIRCYKGDNNTLVGNNVIKNANYGIWIQGTNHVVSDNYVDNNKPYGIWISGSNHLIRQNIVKSNPYGLYLQAANGCLISNNSLIDNNLNAFQDAGSSNDAWNISNMGNYWSDFFFNAGYPDEYIISSTGIDYHPLGKYLVTDLQIEGFEKTFPAEPKVGDNIIFTITLLNEGNYDLNINYSINTGNGRLIVPAQLVNIPSDKTKVIIEYWKYNSYGNWHPTATIDPNNAIPETNENNNQMSILVQIPNPTPSGSGSKKSIISQEFA